VCCYCCRQEEMPIMSLRIPGGEETIWLRTTHFLMACNGCILVSTYHFLHFCSPPVREEEAERAETPSCVASKHRISRTQVSSPKHHSSISTSPHISTTPEPVQSLTNIPSQAAAFPQHKTAPNGPLPAEPSLYSQAGSKATPPPSST
jgi:hypothetical protein